MDYNTKQKIYKAFYLYFFYKCNIIHLIWYEMRGDAMRSSTNFIKETDLYLALLTLIASVAGIIAVFSATLPDLDVGEKISRKQ